MTESGCLGAIILPANSVGDTMRACLGNACPPVGRVMTHQSRRARVPTAAQIHSAI